MFATMKCREIGIAILALTSQALSEDRCISKTKTFTTSVNLYAGALGYYMFEECGDVINPTIEMEVGETYTFIQKDRTNYYHPLAFAYSSYGDQDVQLDLNPFATRNVDNPCATNLTCSAPMYFQNGQYLGIYSNIAQTKSTTANEQETGRAEYTSLFMRSMHDWTKAGNFTIKLKYDDDNFTSDLFYYCDIHEFMGGRIKLTKDGVVLNDLDSPSLGYMYDNPSEFDRECGTFDLGEYVLPNPQCPDRFVCGMEGKSEQLRKFAQCIDAMNCHMFSGMTTGMHAHSEAALFVHHMIPHHENAVNMAKALLKTKTLNCEDLSNDVDPDCVLEGILYDIVNSQNYQIQLMYNFLAMKNFPDKDDCTVEVITKEAVNPTSGVSLTMHFFETLSMTVSQAIALTFLILWS